jgi:hypothetical protein
VLPSPNQTIMFERRKGRASVLVAINLSKQPQQLSLPPAGATSPTAQLDVFSRQPAPTDTLQLPAHGWRILATK